MADPSKPVELVVLGSGTALPTDQRGSPGYLLRFASGGGVLWDAGPGSVRAAARAGCPPARLEAVVLTHFHVDHCLDLFALFFALRNPALRSRHLTVVGPTGVADLCERMTGVFGDWVRLPSDQLQFVELQPGPVQVDLESGRLVGEALRMPHLGHSLGYRLQAERSQVAYSGDTGVGPEPVELGRDVDLYLLEAALPSGSDATSHLTPEKAGQVAAECGCGHLLLSHFYPETEGEDIIASVRRFFSGKLTLAQDQLSLSL